MTNKNALYRPLTPSKEATGRLALIAYGPSIEAGATMAYYPLIDPQRLIALGNRLLKLREAAAGDHVDLSVCPSLISWEFADAHWTGLAGQVSGHPRLGLGNVITTPLVAIDTDLRWARTLNTLYRLDEPLHPDPFSRLPRLGR